MFFFFFKQKTAYEISACLVGSENVYKRQQGRLCCDDGAGRYRNHVEAIPSGTDRIYHRTGGRRNRAVLRKTIECTLCEHSIVMNKRNEQKEAPSGTSARRRNGIMSLMRPAAGGGSCVAGFYCTGGAAVCHPAGSKTPRAAQNSPSPRAGIRSCFPDIHKYLLRRSRSYG